MGLFSRIVHQKRTQRFVALAGSTRPCLVVLVTKQTTYTASVAPAFFSNLAALRSCTGGFTRTWSGTFGSGENPAPYWMCLSWHFVFAKINWCALCAFVLLSQEWMQFITYEEKMRELRIIMETISESLCGRIFCTVYQSFRMFRQQLEVATRVRWNSLSHFPSSLGVAWNRHFVWHLAHKVAIGCNMQTTLWRLCANNFWKF